MRRGFDAVLRQGLTLSQGQRDRCLQGLSETRLEVDFAEADGADLSRRAVRQAEDGVFTKSSFRGDEAAFDEVVERHRTAVYLMARRILGHHEDAEEAAQLAADVSDPARQARALNNVGIGHYHLSEYARALEYYDRSLEIAEEMEPEPLDLGDVRVRVDPRPHARPGNDQRDVDVLREELAPVAEVAVLPERLAVVGGEDDQRTIPQAAVGELVEVDSVGGLERHQRREDRLATVFEMPNA